MPSSDKDDSIIGQASTALQIQSLEVPDALGQCLQADIGQRNEASEVEGGELGEM